MMLLESPSGEPCLMALAKASVTASLVSCSSCSLIPQLLAKQVMILRTLGRYTGLEATFTSVTAPLAILITPDFVLGRANRGNILFDKRQSASAELI